MTTLDRETMNAAQKSVWDAIDARIDGAPVDGKAADGQWNAHVAWQQKGFVDGMRVARLAAIAVLSTIPEQGVKALTSAWLAYWPGAGSIDSVTRVTRSEHEAKRWRDDGAEVTELVERSTPSHPAAVAVTDEMVEAADYLIERLYNISKGIPVRDLDEALAAYRSARADLRSTP